MGLYRGVIVRICGIVVAGVGVKLKVKKSCVIG
jgi:hypothetical protein